MSTKLLIGLDGHSSGERALAYGEEMACQVGGCELLVVYVCLLYTSDAADE